MNNMLRVLDVPPNTTPERVVRAFGPAKRIPGGHHDTYSLCYLSDRPGDRTAIVFSFGITGGGYGLSKELPGGIKAARCSRVNAVHEALALSNGISLGMPEADVKRRLGQPLSASATAANYACTEILRQAAVWRRKEYPPGAAYWLRDASLQARFENGRLVEIRIGEGIERESPSQDRPGR